jgi:galactarate dehydratase
LPDAAREQGFDMQPATAKPLYIRMHADDNVAIVANRGGLHPGAEFACGLRLVEQIPQGHKVALSDIGHGEIIRRYGEVIGHAAAPIARGSWVKEALVQMPDAPSFDNLPTPNGGAIALPPLECYTFEGFRNADGSVGTRNILAISTSVQCVAGTVEFALDRVRKELLPKYPNVDDVVACLWLRGRHQRARRRGPDPHAAEPGPQSQFRRRGDDRWAGLREAAARTVAARGHECR